MQEAADEVGRLVSRTVGLLLCGPGMQAAGVADASGLAERLQLSKQISDAWTASKTSVGSLADSTSLEAGEWLFRPAMMRMLSGKGWCVMEMCAVSLLMPCFVLSHAVAVQGACKRL